MSGSGGRVGTGGNVGSGSVGSGSVGRGSSGVGVGVGVGAGELVTLMVTVVLLERRMGRSPSLHVVVEPVLAHVTGVRRVGEAAIRHEA